MCVLESRGICQALISICQNPYAIFTHISFRLSGCFHSRKPALGLLCGGQLSGCRSQLCLCTCTESWSLWKVTSPDPRRSFMTDRCEDVSTPAPLPLIKITLLCSLTLSPKVPWDGAKDTLHGNIASLLVPLSVSVPLPHSPIVSFFLGKTTNKWYESSSQGLFLRHPD